MIHDYEHSIKTGFLEPDWFLVPDVIPEVAMSRKAERSGSIVASKRMSIYLDSDRIAPSLTRFCIS